MKNNFAGYHSTVKSLYSLTGVKQSLLFTNCTFHMALNCKIQGSFVATSIEHTTVFYTWRVCMHFQTLLRIATNIHGLLRMVTVTIGVLLNKGGCRNEHSIYVNMWIYELCLRHVTNTSSKTSITRKIEDVKIKLCVPYLHVVKCVIFD